MNRKLLQLLQKENKLVIGLLSGTSIDGIDAVLMKVTGNGINTKLKIIDFITYPIPLEIKSAILKNSDIRTSRVDEISQLNVITGALFAEAAIKLLRRNKISSSKVDLIGSHGQTIHHLPKERENWGFIAKSTCQIGDPSVIANITGITTVGDFRIADCAVGGDGAPLVPYLDYILFTSKTKNRALLNIGGISNITVLPKNTLKQNVFAFDTGPGNMLIDGMMYHLYKKTYDKNGGIASSGNVNAELFNYLLNDTMYRRQPPKSTGREQYGIEFQKKLVKQFKGVNRADIISTVTEFTACTIWYNYKNFIENRVKIDELIISGGGAENKALMKTLKSYFRTVTMKKMDQFGINTANKEAVLFGLLANECIAGNPANMRNVTGSARDVILGKICPAL